MPRPLPPIPPREKLTLHRTLSAPALLETIRNAFSKIVDHRVGKVEYPLVDALMSSLAVFGLKCASLLQFDKQREKFRIRHNLRTLYGILKAPCDTSLREICDDVAPLDLQSAFTEVLRQARVEGVLESYTYLGRLLVSVDGTGHFNSGEVHCPECCEKHHRDGTTEYYHQLLGAAVVHPDKPQVLPLHPEAITRQDGTTKNDCESNAAKRLLPRLNRMLPDMPLLILQDALAADGPHIRLLMEQGHDFIITAKESDLPHLFNEVLNRMDKGQAEEYEEVGKDGIIRGYRWVNDLPLNKTHSDIRVNYLDYWEIDKHGKERNFAWITSIELTRETVNPVMRAGRSRWKVENETFNTLKNLGYNLEHNYGHGQNHLATIFATLMMLAFLVDQIQEQACILFKAARNRFYSRKAFWEQIRGLFTEFHVERWEDLWLSILYGHHGGKLVPNTS